MYFEEAFGVEGFSGFNALILGLDIMSNVKYYGKNLQFNQKQIIERKLARVEIQNTTATLPRANISITNPERAIKAKLAS